MADARHVVSVLVGLLTVVLAFWSPLPDSILVVAIGTAAVVLTTTAPLAAGPSIALLGYAAVPSVYLPTSTAVRLLSPAVIALAVWSIRVLLSARALATPRVVTGLTVAIGAWLAFLTLVASPNRVGSAEWSLVWGLGLLLPLLSARLVPGVGRHLALTLCTLSVALSLYAFAEAIAQSNPVYGDDYQQTALTQVWAVYRITTTLGHPLSNSLFYAVSAAWTFGLVVAGRHVRWAAPAATAAFIALLLTASLSGLIAIAAGCLGVILCAATRPDRDIRRLLACGIVLSVALMIGFAAPLSPVHTRQQSTESHGSKEYRSNLLGRVRAAAARTDFVGNGPGTADGAAYAVDKVGLPLENGWGQLLVSLGVLGTTLTAALFAAVGWTALRARQFGALAALGTYTVAAAGFNWFEGNAPGIALLGLICLACLSPPPAAKTVSPAAV